MLAALLRGTDWSKIAEYLSPVLFQVVPPLGMAREIQGLVANYREKAKFDDLRQKIDHQLSKLPWQIQLRQKSEKLGSEMQLGLGDRLLRYYFWQILTQDSAILDLRHKSWTVTENGIALWHPSPLYITWDPKFIVAVRKLYTGFYHDDERLLDEGLESIGLKSGKTALLAHFGANQAKVVFDLAQFRSSFHDVFVACKASKSRLHTNVLGLGAILGCLYENLQTLGGDYDVRAAFYESEDIAKQLIR